MDILEAFADEERTVEKGRDQLLREALSRRAVLLQAADELIVKYEAQAKRVEVLTEALEQLEHKVREAHAKRDLLISDWRAT